MLVKTLLKKGFSGFLDAPVTAVRAVWHGWYGRCVLPGMNQDALPSLPDTQINWLELARLAAAGEGHDDLGRGIRRLAKLAASVHRHHVATTDPLSERVQGRTPGENLQDRQPGTEAWQ